MIQTYSQPYTITPIETKALCAVLRKAEAKGAEALVDQMIDICDAQSGILLQDLWKWWKEHKQQDAQKLSSLQEYVTALQKDVGYGDPNKTIVTC